MIRISTLTPVISIINPLILKGKFNFKAFCILTIFLILSLLVVCVFQLNTYVEETYLIQSYEKRITQLAQENKFLEINFSKVNSLNNISNYVQNFEKAERVEYIRVLEGTAWLQNQND